MSTNNKYLIEQHKEEWDKLRFLAALKNIADLSPIERWALKDQRCGKCEYHKKNNTCTMMKKVYNESKYDNEFCSPYSLCEMFSTKIVIKGTRKK
jgi:hypothetical protein